MRLLKIALAGMLGLGIYGLVFQRPVMQAMALKIGGGDQPCPWPQLAKFPWTTLRFSELQQAASARVTVIQEDPDLGSN